MMVQIWASKATTENLHGRPFLRTTSARSMSTWFLWLCRNEEIAYLTLCA
jgi:hypothetical protein